MANFTLLIEYEQVLLGNRTEYHLISRRNQEEHNPDPSILQASAKYLLNYVFETLLQWTPYQVRDYLNEDIINRYALKNCIKNVPFPAELNSMKDYYYVASWLYPKTVPYNKEKVVLQTYERVLKQNGRYHAHFFKGENGRENFLICLQYALSIEFFGKNVIDIYQYFADPDKAMDFAKKWVLKNHVGKWYEDFEEAVHDALPAGDKSEMLQQFARFMRKYEMEG